MNAITKNMLVKLIDGRFYRIVSTPAEGAVKATAYQIIEGKRSNRLERIVLADVVAAKDFTLAPKVTVAYPPAPCFALGVAPKPLARLF